MAHAELTTLALEREGHEVRRAIDGPGLAELLSDYDADVIVSEWMLGRSDGRAVLSRAAEVGRRRGRELPVVFMTGEDPGPVRAIVGGAVVTKPVRVDLLREAVRRASSAGATAGVAELTGSLRRQ